MHTDNHSPDSVRHRLHIACKAVDFTVKADLKLVASFLRSRPEVAGLNVDRNNGVIHIDPNEHRRVAER